jgi:hypothetical protein
VGTASPGTLPCRWRPVSLGIPRVQAGAGDGGGAVVIKRAPIDLSVRQLYLTSGRAAPRLRIGVLLDSSLIAAVLREVLFDIVQSDFADMTCVVFNDEAAYGSPRPVSLSRRLVAAALDRASRQSVLYTAYRRLYDSRYKSAQDPLQPVDCADLIGTCPALHVTPVRSRFVHRLPPEAVAWIREFHLDVMLRFGFNILRGEVLTTARYGIWSYHHGDNEFYRGGPPMMWELVEDNPVSGVVLQVLDEELDAGLVLCKVLLATSPTPSVSANRFGPYWVAQHFVIRKLKELYEDGWDAVRGRAAKPLAYRGRHQIYTAPANTEMVRWMARRGASSVRSRIKWASKTPHWTIAIRRAATPLYVDSSVEQLGRFQVVESPKGHYWADPFLFEHDDRPWLVYEDYDYQSRRGSLRCAELHEAGAIGESRPLLQRPHHMSYPCIVRDGGEVFLIPESRAAGGVDLYRARRFPSDWDFVCRLLDFPVVDATPFKHDEQWWMFASPMIVAGHAPITLLFVAPQLRGPWRQARASPISSNVADARCGGTVIDTGGKLIRPSQDCRGRYGGALLFQDIEMLSEVAYAEKTRVRVEPTWLEGQVGVHTYNRLRDWEVIDVNRMRRESDVR